MNIMPNWCANNITIYHKNPEMLDRVEKSYKTFLSEFIPTPQELIDTIAGSYSDEDKQRELEAKQKENIDRYGAANWYDWNVSNWGTKWDVELQGLERDDANTIIASFDSAWSPPVAAYKKLEELGFVIEAYFYECGMGYCGHYIDGTDTWFEDLDEYNSETVRDYIGEELDEQFGISSYMADSEQFNEE